MTTDFLITVRAAEKTHFETRYVKFEKDLRDERVCEKLEIERTYWMQQGIPFKVVTEHSFTAVTLAMPFALLGVFLDQLRRTSNIYWIHKADKYAAQGNERGIFITGTWCPLAVSFVLRFIPVFVLTYFGSSVVADAMQTLPAWITKALSTTGNLLPALGFGIILNTIGNRKLLPYFFIGFFAVQYLSIGTMAAAVFGTCLAVLIYFAGNAKKEATSNG